MIKIKNQVRGRCFPLEYYPGEVLTDAEARRNRKMVYSYLSKLPKRNFMLVSRKIKPRF